jgi:hypothetical protein
MKTVLALLLGVASAKNNKNLEGSLSTVSLASLVHKPNYARFGLSQAQDDDESETGYSNQDTVDVSDYTSSAPAQLVQLNKNNSKLDGTLSIVEVRALKPEKMARKDDDEAETGYANQATVDEAEYASSAPISPSELIQLNKADSSEGKSSIVQIKQMKYKNKSHLGEQGDEKEDNSNGFLDHSAVDEDSYSKDAPSLVQLRSNKWGEVSYEDTPDALYHNMWEGTHEPQYVADSP